MFEAGTEDFWSLIIWLVIGGLVLAPVAIFMFFVRLLWGMWEFFVEKKRPQ